MKNHVYIRTSFKKIFLFILLFSCSVVLHSQQGCTDPQATNYNSSATINSGSCVYPASTMSPGLRGDISAFCTESSGLIYINGILWTHNDSGNPPQIFKIDTTAGTLLQTVNITNFPNTDWEDITADSAYIYVSDAGNNNGSRTDLKILRISRTQLTSTASVISATADAIHFVYSDQTSYTASSTNNFDCESVISIGSSLYIFTKDRGDYQTRVYKLSKTPGNYTVSPYTSYNAGGLVTGADYNQQKNEVVLIGYLAGHASSFMWILNNFSGDNFFSGNKRRVQLLNSNSDWQTEGIAYGINPNELFISCETSGPNASLYQSNKSMIKVSSTTGLNSVAQNAASVTVFPNPSSGNITLESSEIILQMEILSADGKMIYRDKPNSNYLLLDRKQLGANAGCFFIKLFSDSGTTFCKLLITE